MKSPGSYISPRPDPGAVTLSLWGGCSITHLKFHGGSVVRPSLKATVPGPGELSLRLVKNQPCPLFGYLDLME